MCHENEEWCKIWSEIDRSVQNWREVFNHFWLQHSTISINCTLMGCFWPRYIIFEHRKYGGIMFDGTQDSYSIWMKTDLCFQKWHEEFCKFSPEHIRKCEKLEFSWVFLSKIENVWAYNLQGGSGGWRGRGVNSKISKIWTLMSCFWLKYIMLELKKGQRN